MFTDESCKNAEACRFCWMCRHICPVAGATGNEAWTPRARGLMVSMIERGTDYDASIAENMYECSMCDACYHDCVTNFKPSVYTREARMMAVMNGIAPQGVMRDIDLIAQTQNIYGDSVARQIRESADSLPRNAENLLYLGQVGRSRGFETGLAVISLLRKAGVSFTLLREEPASGAFLSELMGYTGEVQQQAAMAAKAIRETQCKRVLVLDPHDASFMKEKYCEWNLLPSMEIATVPSFLCNLIKEGKLAPRPLDIQASFQDPCKLSRGIGDVDSAREIMKSLHVELKELFLNRDMSRCCGGVVLDSYSPEVVRSMVLFRQDDAHRIGSKAIINACPDCQYLMRKYGDGTITFYDLFVLLDSAC